jgi:uncharacterized cofD-like protein
MTPSGDQKPAAASRTPPPAATAPRPGTGSAPLPAARRATGEEAPRVVAFGGGTGMSALLRGLRHYTDRITAIVTVTDNGGSSGRLRNEFEIVPPGDIRNCLTALADVDPLLIEAFQYRFSEGEFRGHCFGNLFIAILTRIVGSFEGSIRELNRLLNVKGMVLPAAAERVSLVAHHPDGTKSTGEVQITRSKKKIVRVELRPSPVAMSAEIEEAVAQADLYLFGPGSLFTSVIPNLLIEGLMEAVNRTARPRVYIGNIMTQPGETLEMGLGDHIRALRAHVGDEFPDAVIAHSGEIPRQVLEKYAREGASQVEMDLDRPEFQGIEVITANFYTGGETVRHDPAVLARLIHDRFLSGLKARPGPLAP